MNRRELEQLGFVIRDGVAVKVRDAGPDPRLTPRTETWRYEGPLQLPPSGRSEDAEQEEIQKLFRAYGLRVYRFSQKRASKQTPGIPDLGGFIPPRAWRLDAGGWWWWETKVEGGEISPAQVEFGQQCRVGSVPYGRGDLRAAADWLVSIGVAVHHGDWIEPRRD